MIYNISKVKRNLIDHGITNGWVWDKYSDGTIEAYTSKVVTFEGVQASDGIARSVVKLDVSDLTSYVLYGCVNFCQSRGWTEFNVNPSDGKIELMYMRTFTFSTFNADVRVYFKGIAV